MRLTVLSGAAEPQALKRLQMLGHRVQTEATGKVKALDGASSDLVYLVPFEESKKPEWAEIRVRLARSSRFYLVYGSELSTANIVAAARDGANDVIDQRDEDSRWDQAISSCASSQSLWWQLYGAAEKPDDNSLVGRSAVMQSLRESVQRIGPTRASVLVMGESGTGKERVSEAIHKAWGKGPFIAMNCAAIPGDLLESELFGVEKGAFTGANQSKQGLVEEAAGGTLFLDEIGELDLQLQPKLLRFLETHRARRVGSTKEYQCNVRIVAATNRDLRIESDNDRFRLDLYYRLSEIILNTAPLRHRVEDIPDLARVFLDGAAIRFGKNFETIEPELAFKFQQHDWPGNVRELKQVVERLAIHYDGPVMRASWWEIPPPTLKPKGSGSQPPFAVEVVKQTVAPFPSATPASPVTPTPFRPPPSVMPAQPAAASLQSRHGMPLNKRERQQLARELLNQSDGDLTWTAAQLGIHPTTLYRWRKAGKV
ncbi:sigma-54 dependent transcriptional regulator [Rubellicoccus peritrichatus]|uniref:Sigma-54 dependent transcriptional regulator n=1 Tax=Rubellicoccus peritrichatus TaxID=3080537 RepID=A0AAQ3LA50_9BACT|nr:sigma-54 dependent transcriptional regulator [Puniceicoccus sp. CR14]WOO42464.1 sigma-54 dependent transcriptional regulator [Puniceicoccus sp. CR14]